MPEPAVAISRSASLDAPELYLNRELTWLAYNRRLLELAEDDRTPLLERLRFLGLVGANLDEFFMRRVGGLMQQVAAGVEERTVDGRTAADQILECRTALRAMEVDRQRILKSALSALRKKGVAVVPYRDLTGKEREAVRAHYVANVFPLVTPHAMSPAHPFPFVSNLSLNLLVTVRPAPGAAVSLARVKVPVGKGIPRFVRVGEADRFVRLEQVIAKHLDLLFPDVEVEAAELFRVTRNAATERDEEEAEDLLEMIRAEVSDRKLAPIVRLEVEPKMAPSSRRMLASELELDQVTGVDEVDGIMAHGDLMELADLKRPALRFAAHHPVEPPAFHRGRNVFHDIRDAGTVLLHHPYESFDVSVMQVLREAASDPKVRAIKMTLYRSEPEIVGLLVEAAINGKQVTVVIELKARFVEEANIRNVALLEEHGINVTYGVVGLKTHCQIMLVVRQDYDGLKRYAHIGTGNYHPAYARVQSDLGVLVRDADVGADLSEVFNYLTTGYKPDRGYRRLLVAPKQLRRELLHRIEREVEHGKAGLIQMKVNALEDPTVVRALYRASQAGVRIDLIVRDTCRLRPGLDGFSETIRVVSVLGRFREHARVYYFLNGGDEEYFLGSADAMRRNFESRVEVLVPVIDPDARAELRFLIDTQLADPRGAWDMHPDGSYERRRSKRRKDASSQEVLGRRAEKRARQRRKRRRGPGFIVA